MNRVPKLLLNLTRAEQQVCLVDQQQESMVTSLKKRLYDHAQVTRHDIIGQP